MTADQRAAFKAAFDKTDELLARGKVPELVEMATAHDRDLLDALLRALFVLVDGVLPKRWERAA